MREIQKEDRSDNGSHKSSPMRIPSNQVNDNHLHNEQAIITSEVNTEKKNSRERVNSFDCGSTEIEGKTVKKIKKLKEKKTFSICSISDNGRERLAE